MNVQRIRHDLRHSDAGSLWERRASIGLSLVGMASMGATSLLQTGLVRHLPDPPIRGFNSDKVNLSDQAFPFGVPDGTIALVGYALNVPLAAIGGADRAKEVPWIPLMVTAKAAVDSAISGWLFYQMPTRERAWCVYCIVAFFVNLALLKLALPEGRKAWAVIGRQ